MSEPLRLPTLLLGATGRTGRAVLERAEPASIRAYCRDPRALAEQFPDVPTATGDFADRAALRAALRGCGSVICLVGPKPGSSPAHLLETGTRALLGAMPEVGVDRLVCVTGMGAGDSRGHGPWWYDRIVRPTVLRTVYADKDRQEALITPSAQDWTIVRPSVLRREDVARPVRTLTALVRAERMRSIGIGQVADFLLEEVRTGAHLREIVNLCT